MNIDLDYTVYFEQGMDLLNGKTNEVNSKGLFEDPTILIKERITRLVKDYKLNNFLNVFEKIKDAARGNGGKVNLNIDEANFIGRIRYECDTVLISNSENDICKKAFESILDLGENIFVGCDNGKLVIVIVIDLVH